MKLLLLLFLKLIQPLNIQNTLFCPHSSFLEISDMGIYYNFIYIAAAIYYINMSEFIKHRSHGSPQHSGFWRSRSIYSTTKSSPNKFNKSFFNNSVTTENRLHS